MQEIQIRHNIIVNQDSESDYRKIYEEPSDEMVVI